MRRTRRGRLAHSTDYDTRYVTERRNRDGSIRRYWQVSGQKPVRLPNDLDWAKGYQAFKVAEAQLACHPTDEQAYDWLGEHCEDYHPPRSLASFKQYLTEARAYYDDRKNAVSQNRPK